MIFATRVNGIPCQCSVVKFTSPIPATFDDPSEGSEFEFDLLDSRGKPAPWLEKYITPEVSQQLFEDFQVMQSADYFTHN